MNSLKGKEEYNKRMTTVEPVFGILKKQHNLDELEQREMKRVQTELNLMAIAHNIKTTYTPTKSKIKKKNNKKIKEKFKKFSKRFSNKIPHKQPKNELCKHKKEKT